MVAAAGDDHTLLTEQNPPEAVGFSPRRRGGFFRASALASREQMCYSGTHARLVERSRSVNGTYSGHENHATLRPSPMQESTKKPRRLSGCGVSQRLVYGPYSESPRHTCTGVRSFFNSPHPAVKPRWSESNLSGRCAPALRTSTLCSQTRAHSHIGTLSNCLRATPPAPMVSRN